MKTKVKQRTLLAFGLAVCLVLTLVFGLPFAKKTTASAATSAAPDLSMFSFSKVGTTHYRVSLIDDTVKKAVIPEEYNGLPVKEIAAGGFSYCDQLEEVYIPETITKIGSSAFMSCDKLDYITMFNVETIGQAAFSSCESLQAVVIPQSVTTIGSSAFSYSKPKVFLEKEVAETIPWTNWLSGYTGDPVKDIKYGHEGVAGVRVNHPNPADDYYKITGAIIKDPNYDLALDYYNINSPSNPYDESGETLRDENSLPIGLIVTDAFKDQTLRTITVGKFSTHDILIENGAFGKLNAEGAWLDNNVKLVDKENHSLPAVSMFNKSNIKSVVLPDSLEVIGASMFQNCKYLTEIRFVSYPEINTLSPNVKKINSNAFTSCTALNFLYIPNTVTTIDAEDGSPFSGWADKSVRVSFASAASRPSGWSSDWYDGKGTPLYKASGNPAQYTVTFDNEGTTVGSTTVKLYESMTPNLEAPTRTGYKFAGYFTKDAQGNYVDQYYYYNMVGRKKWDIAQNTTLYAKWIKDESETIINIVNVFPYNPLDVVMQIPNWMDKLAVPPISNPDRPIIPTPPKDTLYPAINIGYTYVLKSGITGVSNIIYRA